MKFRDFGETFRGERLQERGENSDKYILWSLTSKTKRDFGNGEKIWKKRLRTNKKTKRGLKAWIPAGVYPREDGDGNDREERIQGRRENSGTKRDLGKTERDLGKI